MRDYYSRMIEEKIAREYTSKLSKADVLDPLGQRIIGKRLLL